MQRFVRFGAVGVIATLVHIVVFCVLAEAFYVPPVVAAAPSFVLATLVSYGLNRIWTFSSHGDHRAQLIKYFVVALLGLALNMAITYVVVDILHQWYGIALFLVVSVLPILTYSLNHRWTFARASESVAAND